MHPVVTGSAKSKTMYFALALAVLGVVQTSADVFTQFLSPQAQGLLTLGVGVAVAVLRILTTAPLDEK